METKRFTQQLIVLLVAIVTTASAWAQGGSGNGNTRAGDEVFIIATKADWKTLCDRVHGGEMNINVKMTADIDLGTDIWRLGNSIENYSGTFDGQGHTLSFNWTGGTNLAPFEFVNGATIKNLRTRGTINATGQSLAGLLYQAYGATTISNCITDVDITSSYNGDFEAAGMIGWVGFDGQVTIKDCVVKGSITATKDGGKRGMAGFVYEQDNSLAITNCLYVGTNNATGGNTFAPNSTLTDCYYLNTCGTAQGTPTTKEQLKSGEMAWLLQGKRTEQFWGQTLGTDTIPQPTNDAKKRVYKVTFTHNGKDVAVRYANRGGNVGTLPTAQEILGAAYNAQETYTLTFDGGFSETTAITGDMKVNVTVTITTGIDDVTAGMKNGAVYDLQGRRVANRLDDAARHRLPAGVYIVNGKKILVK